jgi:hypothetical protein
MRVAALVRLLWYIAIKMIFIQSWWRLKMLRCALLILLTMVAVQQPVEARSIATYWQYIRSLCGIVSLGGADSLGRRINFDVVESLVRDDMVRRLAERGLSITAEVSRSCYLRSVYEVSDELRLHIIATIRPVPNTSQIAMSIIIESFTSHDKSKQPRGASPKIEFCPIDDSVSNCIAQKLAEYVDQTVLTALSTAKELLEGRQ